MVPNDFSALAQVFQQVDKEFGSMLSGFSRTFSTMTVESFHDYDQHFRPFTLILFHDNNRSHMCCCCHLTHGFADFQNLCLPFSPPNLCFPSLHRKCIIVLSDFGSISTGLLGQAHRWSATWQMPH